jgi:hypothetical protein
MIQKLQTGCNTVINQCFTKYDDFRTPVPEYCTGVRTVEQYDVLAILFYLEVARVPFALSTLFPCFVPCFLLLYVY